MRKTKKETVVEIFCDICGDNVSNEDPLKIADTMYDLCYKHKGFLVSLFNNLKQNAETDYESLTAIVIADLATRKASTLTQEIVTELQKIEKTKAKKGGEERGSTRY